MLPGIVVINPGFIRADSKVGGGTPPPLNVGDIRAMEGGRGEGEIQRGRGRKEKVAKFRRNLSFHLKRRP